MRIETMEELKNLINEYETIIRVMSSDAHTLDEEGERAYGGYVRATKGKLLEYITKRLIEIAWITQLGQSEERLDINSSKIDLTLNKSYLSHLPSYLKEYIEDHLEDYYYGVSVDRQVFIDQNFIFGIECKAFTENAMLKRIMVDFMFLKTVFPKINCYLFQLESMLGGDYSRLEKDEYGSPSSHTIMSYFPNIHLKILTFMRGERNVNKPIHNMKHYKPLPLESLVKAVSLLSQDFTQYI